MSDHAISPKAPWFHHDSKKVNGIELHYVTSGEGDPVLLLHGFLGTWFTWRRVIPLLSDTYTLIAPDMRGCGDSDKPPCDYDALRICEDFRALVKELGHKRLRIVGHGIGASVALLWAARYPDEVSQITYLSMPVLTSKLLAQGLVFYAAPERVRNRWWWGFAQSGELAEQLVVGREREFLDWFYRNHAVHPRAVEEAFHEYLRTFSGHRGVAGSMGPYRSIFHSIDQTEDALGDRKIEAPIMALAGSKGGEVDVRGLLEQVASNVTGGIIEDCGHFIPEEQSELLAGRLQSFLVTG